MNWWAANTVIFVLSHVVPNIDQTLGGLDVSGPRDPQSKAVLLHSSPTTSVNQIAQLKNPDARLLLSSLPDLPLLQDYAESLQGISPADFPHFGRFFWEIHAFTDWRFWQSTIEETVPYGGRELLLWWNEDLLSAMEQGRAFLRGEKAWGRAGVVIRQMRHLPSAVYTGEPFDTNCAVILPRDPSLVPAIWAFCSSNDFLKMVRQIDQKTNVTNATLVKVPFDLAHWQRVATEKYPGGLPKPFSSDPTQWLFNGHPHGSDHPLQVAAARLVGYRWPRQTGSSFPDCPALGNDGLEKFADSDGIVCISAIKGEEPAAERLRTLLAAAYGSEWGTGKQAELLTPADYAGKSLEDWLRNGFFEQHCAFFHHRPFIWHIWDGRKDGFSALVNYHQLTKANLEKLTYSYLGDWISRQKAAVSAGEAGSDARLQAAKELQGELQKILEGEPPYDIFVRWKPIEKQPIGWDPDLNDGVRLNIRPFMSAKDVGKRGAGILRAKPNINWNKDRGTDVPSAPWFKVFKGERINDHHLTIDEKRKAQAAHRK